jgi:hypothetical protein
VVDRIWTAPELETIEGTEPLRSWVTGVDLGLLLRGDRWSLGGALYDVTSPLWRWEGGDRRPADPPRDRVLEPSWRVGFAAELPWEIPGTVESPRVAVDLTEAPRGGSFGTRISLGLDARLLRWLRVAVGVHQGYPTFGATLNLPIVQVGYARSTSEWGNRPGQLGIAEHWMTIRVGFGG